MKISIDIDITPEEFRRLMGLPYVSAFQQEMMNQIRDRMLAGVEGYDPMKMFQPYYSSALSSWDLWQKMFSAAVSPGGGSRGSEG